MDQQSERQQTTTFPRVDRSVVAVGGLDEPPDDRAYWLSRTPDERLAAMELMRQIAYGYDPATERLQRVLEVAPFPPR